jgi:hypothetical protein
VKALVFQKSAEKVLEAIPGLFYFSKKPLERRREAADNLK